MENDNDKQQVDPDSIPYAGNLLPASGIRYLILYSDEIRAFLLAYHRRFLPIIGGLLYLSVAIIWALH